MSNASKFVPSFFGSPLVTTMPSAKYNDKGRQLSFPETNVQRLERLAFVEASKSRAASPASSKSSSTASSPSSSPMRRPGFISEPFCDPIELMANKLAEEWFSSDEWSSSDEEGLGMPSRSSRAPIFTPPPATRGLSSAELGKSKPGHKRKRASLSSIPEED